MDVFFRFREDFLRDRPNLGIVNPSWRVFDPFAGVGTIHKLTSPNFKTTGLEIEPEWAEQRFGTAVGDALKIPFKDDAFHFTFTSPVYGNRMSDHHNAVERCSTCYGSGFGIGSPCEKCAGTGKRDYIRMTYTHVMGRPLHANNAGTLHFPSEDYKDFHIDAWTEVTRVTTNALVLNCKNFIAKGKVQKVNEWHISCLMELGWFLNSIHTCPVRSMKFGQNFDARLDNEWVMLFTRRRKQDYESIPVWNVEVDDPGKFSFSGCWQLDNIRTGNCG